MTTYPNNLMQWKIRREGSEWALLCQPIDTIHPGHGLWEAHSHYGTEQDARDAMDERHDWRDVVRRCGIHGTPTYPFPRCSACDNLLPYWHELVSLPSLAEAQTANLRVDTGDFRVWTARTGLEDGEPYEQTVYVEALDDERGWLDLGHYDGLEPPRGLPGVTPHAFRGEMAYA